MGIVIRSFCWHQNFVPWGLSAPAPGLYKCIKSWKNCTKSDLKDIFLKLATNEWSDKTFLLTSKFCPLEAVCPCPGAIYMYKMDKNCIKSDLKRFFFKTCNKWLKRQDVPVDIKIWSPIGCQPLPGAIYMYKIMKKKKMYKIRLQTDCFETCSKWPKLQEVSVDIKLCPLGLSALYLRLYTFIKSWKDVYKVRAWRDSF